MTTTIRRFGRLAYPHEESARGTSILRIPTPAEVDALRSVLWEPNCHTPLDQGGVGSCTGNAVAQCASTQPFGLALSEEDAVRCYSRATELDQFPGSYPPNDTGSTGWAAMAAAVEMGWFSGFQRSGSVYAVLLALQTRPGVCGTDWYAGGNEPDEGGVVRDTGVILGGHEVLIAGCELVRNREGYLVLGECAVVLRNSWGPRWGVELGGASGYFRRRLTHFQGLLSTGGDAHFPDVP